MPRFSVTYGDARIEGGYFLKRPRQGPESAAYTDLQDPLCRHVSTFPERSTIKETVLDLLERARRHVFFCNFLLQDQDVVQGLLAAAERLAGHVYVLTTLKADDLSRADGAEEEGEFESHMNCVRQLSERGLPVKARSDCHAKFMTIDDAQALITSANAVPTCYGNVKRANGNTREANPENGVVFSVPTEVRRLANFFRAIWRDAYNYYVSPDPTVFEVQQLRGDAPPVQSKEPPAPAEQGEALWTAPEDPRLLDRFVRMLEHAQERVVMSTWVIKGMDDHILGRAIREAAMRGVECHIIVRGMNRRDDHRHQCYLLTRDLGERCAIWGDYWNHSKAVVADSREALVLTANMDAQHGLDGGVEVGFHSTQIRFVEAVNGFLSRLAREAAFEFVPDPSQKDMAERYGRQKGTRLTGDLRIKFMAGGSYIAELVDRWCKAAGRELVRVAEKRDGKGKQIVLSTNRVVVYARLESDGRLSAHDINDDPPPEDRRIFDSYLGPGTITCEVGK